MVEEELTIAAILQMSVLAPHFAPSMTSGDRYCLVWMSFVKWCPTQQALPRSAILTDIVSIGLGDIPALSLSDVVLLLREIPDMSWVNISLCLKSEESK